MVRRGDIEALHQRTARAFMALLEGQCEIEPPTEFRANWHRRELQEQVSFFLWSRGAQQFGVRSGSATTSPVVPGKIRSPDWNNEERTWVGWREIWRHKAQDQFSLEEAAFTFFWGRPSVEPIGNQLFRAEWPQKPAGSKTSAQPHWQVDWPLADLEHVVAGIHFGMAGWECENLPEDNENGANVADHVSKNWRRFVQDDPAVLETWAVRTLEYSLDQIVNFYPKDLV